MPRRSLSRILSGAGKTIRNNGLHSGGADCVIIMDLAFYKFFRHTREGGYPVIFQHVKIYGFPIKPGMTFRNSVFFYNYDTVWEAGLL